MPFHKDLLVAWLLSGFNIGVLPSLEIGLLSSLLQFVCQLAAGVLLLSFSSSAEATGLLLPTASNKVSVSSFFFGGLLPFL